MNYLQISDNKDTKIIPDFIVYKSHNFDISFEKSHYFLPKLKNKTIDQVFKYIFAFNGKKIYKHLFKFFNCVKNNITNVGYDPSQTMIISFSAEKAHYRYSLRIRGRANCSRNKVYMSRLVLTLKPKFMLKEKNEVIDLNDINNDKKKVIENV